MARAEALARQRWGVDETTSIDPGPAPDISIIMPCLDEEATVGRCVRKAREWVRATGVTGEVIVVDNGSTDQSRVLALAAGARVIDEEQRGYGAALMRGLAEARGNYLVMGDCDDTYDFSELGGLVAPLEQGADMVVGDRYAGMQPGAMTWSHRYIGTPAISFLLRLFTGSRLHDSQCGLRAFTRDAYDRMGNGTSGMEFASEMILKATRRGMKVAEVPIKYYARDDESSAKLRTFRDGWRHLRFLLLATPNGLFMLPGAMLTVFGLALAVAAIVSPSGGVAVGGVHWQPVFAAPIFTVVGVNALLFGAMARLATTSRGLTPPDVTYRIARRVFTFEFAVAGTLALVSAGIILDIALAAGLPSHEIAVAALAQTLILTGANVFLGGCLGAILGDLA